MITVQSVLTTDIARFPFIADVWGTAADWAIVIITGITAYYLYKTLRSQRIVQEQQQELLKIEQARYRKMQLPRFELTAKMTGKQRDSFILTSHIEFTFTLQDNHAKDIQLSVLESEAWNFQYPEQTIDEMPYKDTFDVKGILTVNDSELSKSLVRFVIKYRDTDDNNYSQSHLFRVLQNGNFEPLSFAPELVNMD